MSMIPSPSPSLTTIMAVANPSLMVSSVRPMSCSPVRLPLLLASVTLVRVYVLFYQPNTCGFCLIPFGCVVCGVFAFLWCTCLNYGNRPHQCAPGSDGWLRSYDYGRCSTSRECLRDYHRKQRHHYWKALRSNARRCYCKQVSHCIIGSSRS